MEDGARAGAAVDFVVAPDMSLNRLVVPRVAPMLELPEVLELAVPELAVPEPAVPERTRQTR